MKHFISVQLSPLLFPCDLFSNRSTACILYTSYIQQRYCAYTVHIVHTTEILRIYCTHRTYNRSTAYILYTSYVQQKYCVYTVHIVRTTEVLRIYCTHCTYNRSTAYILYTSYVQQKYCVYTVHIVRTTEVLRIYCTHRTYNRSTAYILYTSYIQQPRFLFYLSTWSSYFFIFTGCVVPSRGDWAIFCHALSRQVDLM